VHAVHEQVLAAINDPSHLAFDDLALQVFTHQFDTIAPYRRFCEQRRRTPRTIARWDDIPPVPIQAFREVDLSCGTPQRTFVSSGTTRGTSRRSRHHLPDLRLYRASAVAGLRRFLFPDVERMRIIALVQPVADLPHSSLAQMVAWALADFGDEQSGYVIGPQQIDFDQLVQRLRDAERMGVPCCLLATTAALLRVLDYAREHDLSFRLPHASRLMDPGGDKGAPRRLSRNGILHACWSTFAIPGYFCANEYGMTELSSQYYENVIANRVAGRHHRRALAAPPWLRTVVLDPATLAPLPAGESGLLCHFDLANAGSVMAILTEDTGRASDGEIHIVGRAKGAEVRGCSLSLAEWQSSQDA
jgi:hypothetical protein